MSLDIVKLHELIDKWYQEEINDKHEITTEEVKIERELPKDKRAVRTKSQGDKVFFLDEVKKTRQWVTSPEVLASLGFEIGDVTEVTDEELLRYQMAAAIYKPVDGQT